jgi:hypothetical protein
MGLSERARRHHPWNLLGLGVFVACEALLVGTATAALDTDLLLLAFGLTGAITLGLAGFALQTRWVLVLVLRWAGNLRLMLLLEWCGWAGWCCVGLCQAIWWATGHHCSAAGRWGAGGQVGCSSMSWSPRRAGGLQPGGPQ